MKNVQTLASLNEEWGFWGTCEQAGYETKNAWDAANQFFIKTFNLTGDQARNLLDARFGRHLADDLSFIKGPITAKAITSHLEARFADAGWRKHFEKSIHDVLGVKVARAAAKTKDELFAEIAKVHLNIETLAERKSDSLDFKEVAVWNVKAALEAAFQAGKAARKGA